MGVRLLLALLLTLGGSRVQAVELIADLSHHLIAITTAFSGSEVLLFGTIAEPGGDIIVTVRGPITRTTVRRKSRVGPVWLNTEEVVFDNVPAFYRVAASKPLALIAEPDVLARHGVGAGNLPFVPVDADDLPEAKINAFREALIRNKQASELYGADTVGIRFLGDVLFRTTLFFPANVPPGTYQVEVLYLRDGFVTGAQASVLVVSKVGVEAEIYDVAQNNGALYGLASILLAITAGWTASAIFKKT